MLKDKKIVLVADWLDKYAGSERVMTSLITSLNIDEVYTMINIMKEEDIRFLLDGRDVPIYDTNLRYTGKFFRYLLPLFPFFIESIKLPSDAEVIISSSHAVAKGVKKPNKDVVHISYFQARNLKYIWDNVDLYFSGVKSLFKIFIPYLRKKDIQFSKNPDFIISNSHFVKDWVKRTYYRDSSVIYPPVDVDKFTLSDKKENYYIAVGRLEPYKRFDVLVKAFNKLGKKLVVVGSGSEEEKLKKIAKENIHFTGYLTTAKLAKLLSKAKAYVHVGIEDFGISAVEAQASGLPVICINKGGTAETVIDMETGIHFENISEEDLIQAVEFFEKHEKEFNPYKIRKHSEKFSRKRFEQEIKEFVEKVI